jgi:hypothetical protein
MCFLPFDPPQQLGLFTDTPSVCKSGIMHNISTFSLRNTRNTNPLLYIQVTTQIFGGFTTKKRALNLNNHLYHIYCFHESPYSPENAVGQDTLPDE